MKNGGLLMILLLMAYLCHAQPVMRIDSSFKTSGLSGYLQLFTDSTNRLSLAEVSKQSFRPLVGSQPNLGTDGLMHWARFSCLNAASTPKLLVLEVDNIFFDEVSFYCLQKGELLQENEHISWHTPIEARPVESRHYAFSFMLKPKQTVEVYVKMQYRGGLLVCPFILWEHAYFQKQQTLYTTVYLIPLAILALVCLISLLSWGIYRESILLYYAIYTGGTLGFLLKIEGFLSDFANFFLWGPKGWIICSSIAWIGNLLFTEQFVFRLPNIPSFEFRRFSFKSLLIFVWVFLLITLLVPDNGALAFTALAISIINPLFVFAWLLFGLRYHLPEARLYLVAITPVLLLSLLIAVGGAGVLPFGNKLFVLLYYASPIEVIILGFGLIRQFFRERERLLLTVQATQTDLLNAQETERRRLAQDLHDDIGTSLIALRGKLSPNNSDAHHLLDQIITDVRAVSHNLMPDELVTLGLSGAVAEVSRRLAETSGIRFLFVSVGDIVPLSPVAELALYRAVLELLHNVVRHSQATEAVVQLVYHPDLLNVTVEDNGQGFGKKKAASDKGIGLKNVVSRTEWLGGKMAIDSSAIGTTVRLDIPYGIHTS